MIQATIPAGVSALTVHGLHQWDYGQKLQLQADGLPNLIEVHYGCPGMKEAEVRLATLEGGVATVSIPDRCLEQPAPITAWVYLVDEVSGRTALELTLPVIPRLKPAIAGSSEEEEKAGDKYDQLFGLVEEAYDGIEACKNVEANAAGAQASANAAASSASASAGSASQSAASASAAAASASAAEESASSVAATAAVLDTCLNISANLNLVSNEADSGRDTFYTSPVKNRRAFFYAFFIDTTTEQMTPLGIFLWNGVGSVEISNGNAYGLRVELVEASTNSLTVRATLLIFQNGNVVEYTPRPANIELYIQRLTN